MWETASARFSKDLWARLRVHGSGTVHRPVRRERGGTALETSRRRLLVLPSGRAFQRDRIRVVHDAIEDGVGDGRLAQIRVPLIAGELARDNRRAGRVAILHHFEKVLALDISQGRQAPVIDHQHIDAGEPRQQSRVRAVGARQGELLKEPR